MTDQRYLPAAQNSNPYQMNGQQPQYQVQVNPVPNAVAVPVVIQQNTHFRTESQVQGQEQPRSASNVNMQVKQTSATSDVHGEEDNAFSPFFTFLNDRARRLLLFGVVMLGTWIFPNLVIIISQMSGGNCSSVSCILFLVSFLIAFVASTILLLTLRFSPTTIVGELKNVLSNYLLGFAWAVSAILLAVAVGIVARDDFASNCTRYSCCTCAPWGYYLFGIAMLVFMASDIAFAWASDLSRRALFICTSFFVSSLLVSLIVFDIDYGNYTLDYAVGAGWLLVTVSSGFMMIAVVADGLSKNNTENEPKAEWKSAKKVISVIFFVGIVLVCTVNFSGFLALAYSSSPIGSFLRAMGSNSTLLLIFGGICCFEYQIV